MESTSHTQANSKTTGLHVCGGCGSGLVQPTRWEQGTDRGHWRLWRRCPECEWSCDAVHGEREIDAYDEVLDAGTQALSGVLKQLERENMQHVADSFTAALAADLITADDFR
jgi:transcription elongation factor Elf1